MSDKIEGMGHRLFHCGELPDMCLTCMMETTAALETVKCGDQKGYARFIKRRKKDFFRQLKASIQKGVSR